jgi:hypothetical protein
VGLHGVCPVKGLVKACCWMLESVEDIGRRSRASN